MAALQMCQGGSRTAKDLAHVKDGSQATPSRKGFDHYIVHFLRNDIDQRVDKLLFAATYVVDDDPSWTIPIALIVQGAHACYRSMHQSHLTKKQHNEHSSNPSNSSPFKSLICVACPETRLMLTLGTINIRASLDAYNKRRGRHQVGRPRPTIA